MAGDHDVVIVGARCAGASLAVLLARAGLSVAVVDRAIFPSDTLSTHVFQNEGVAVLDRLGVLETVRSSGAPWLAEIDLRIDGLRVRRPLPVRAGDPGPWLCVRRPALDAALVAAATAAGADVRPGQAVTALVQEDGSVAGVETPAGVLRAPLVVGADGRGSAVARLAGARAYNLVPNQRLVCWGYFESAAAADPATVLLHRWDREAVLGCPTDAGLFMAAILAPLERRQAYREDPDTAFATDVARCEELAAALAGARRVGPLTRMMRWTGYLRESAGPGWVLVGDAGHFKDPTPGQGISDALRQAERLAGEVVAGLDGSRDLDEAMAGWWRWRDGDAAEMAWFAGDLGRDGTVPPVLVEILTSLAGKDDLDPFLEIFSHRVAPSEVLTPPRLLAATARLLARGDHPRRQTLRQTRDIVTRDVRRQRLNRHPAYAGAGDHVGAPTDPDPEI
ncbi:MAG TPA: NAD(P)/FAD-dependent oxidoreductase [Acidimicrobiales bacterium]|nr:NAD(P)/FAD-dependent oxidoreductase [Acidimicrobiales bacterium]